MLRAILPSAARHLPGPARTLPGHGVVAIIREAIFVLRPDGAVGCDEGRHVYVVVTRPKVR